MARLGLILLLVPLLAVAVVSFVFIRAKSGDGASFVTAQRQAQALTPVSVDRVVRLAPDPATRARGQSATCAPRRAAGNCTTPGAARSVTPADKRIQWRVQIRADGSFVGSDQRLIYLGRATTGVRRDHRMLHRRPVARGRALAQLSSSLSLRRAR